MQLYGATNAEISKTLQPVLHRNRQLKSLIAHKRNHIETGLRLQYDLIEYIDSFTDLRMRDLRLSKQFLEELRTTVNKALK